MIRLNSLCPTVPTFIAFFSFAFSGVIRDNISALLF